MQDPKSRRSQNAPLVFLSTAVFAVSPVLDLATSTSLVLPGWCTIIDEQQCLAIANCNSEHRLPPDHKIIHGQGTTCAWMTQKQKRTRCSGAAGRSGNMDCILNEEGKICTDQRRIISVWCLAGGNWICLHHYHDADIAQSMQRNLLTQLLTKV